jgi:hypothetical protein
MVGAVFILVMALHLGHARHYFFLADDSFISFRYVKNWSEGLGLVFNPGERVEGYTNFLWVVLLTPLKLAGIAPEKAAPVLSVLCSTVLLTLVFMFPALALCQKGPRPEWLIAPLILALNRSYAVWATGGLETRMFALLVFAGALFAWRAATGCGRRGLRWSMLLLVGAELTRPEGGLFLVMAVALVVFFRGLRRERVLAWPEVACILMALALVAAHYVGRRAYYGVWFPNTFYAKATRLRIGQGLGYLALFGLEYALYLLVLPAFFYFSRAWKERDFLPWFCLMFYTPHLAYLAVLGGDHFEYRFLDPELPALAVLVQQGVVSWVRGPGAFPRRRQAAAAAGMAVFLLYFTSFPWATGLSFGPDYITGQVPVMDRSNLGRYRFIPGFSLLGKGFESLNRRLIRQFIGVRAEEHRRFGARQIAHGHIFQRFVDEGYLNRHDVISINVIGAVPYYSGLFTIDQHGLTDAVVARLPPDQNGALFHDRQVIEPYLTERRVDFIFAGDYLVRFDPNRLPVFKRRKLDPEQWTGRIYLVHLDEWLLIFQSTRPPSWLLDRFEPKGAPVYVLYRESGTEYKPFLLRELVRKGLIPAY